jgi:filamentous hemagglutinin family protein
MKNTSSVHRGARPRVRAARNLTAGPVRAGFRPAGLALAVAAACLGASSAFGQPAGAQVIQGQAQLQQQGNSLVVTTQNAAGTNRSVINWQSFSVPAGSTTRFDQPSAQSLSINRVVGNDPSAIYGTLSSNGRLVLVNPAGIAVGAGAVVDTAGFTASTLRLSEADALAGRLRFQADGTAAPLTVQGHIVARGGDVVLIAPQVQVGVGAVVESQGGATILAAGQKVEVTGRGLDGISMQVQAPADAAVNLGTLKGDAVGIFAGTLKHSGLIQAQTVMLEGGRVVLKALANAGIAPGARIHADGAAAGKSGGQVAISAATGDLSVGQGAVISANAGAGGTAGMVRLLAPQGTVRVAGALAALAPAQTATLPAAGSGGRVEVLGREVALDAGAAIDVAGDAGGGTILVGGDMQGANSSVLNALNTSVAVGVTLNADARLNGDGGKVIVWADNDTHFAGSLSARGGEYGGNGGFGETSGKHVLYFRGTADLSAGRGRRGTLLLDPANITVANTAAIDGTSGDISSPTDLDNTTDYAGANSQITATTLASLLNSTDVTLAATNTITISSAVIKTATGPATTLTLNATDININNTIGSTGGALNLALNASGTASLNSTYKNGTLTSSSGTLAINSGTLDTVTIGSNLTVNGNLNISNGLKLGDGVVIGKDSSTWTMVGSGTQSIAPVSGMATLVMAGGNIYTYNPSVNTQTVVLGAGLTVQGYGALWDSWAAQTWVNNGTIIANSSVNALVLGGGTFTNTGTLAASGGAMLALNLDSFSNGGVMDVGASSTISSQNRSFTNASTGVIRGVGTINLGGGAYTLTNNGTIAPGVGASPSVGTLSINGNLVQGAGASMQVDLGGTGAGLSDRIHVSGNVTLDGALIASVISGYAPVDGDEASVLTRTGTSTGAFALTSLPTGFYAGYNLYTGEAARVSKIPAGSKYFNNMAGTLEWGNAANWSGASLPTSTDSAYIKSGFAVTHAYGTDTVGSLTVNGNSLDVSGGSLSVLGTADIGGALLLTGGAVAMAGTLNSAGLVQISSGTLGLGGTSSISALNMSGGTLTGAGALTVTGPFNVSGGTFSGSGGLKTTGTTTVTAPTLVGNGATWTNQGALTIQGGGAIDLHDGFGPATFLNDTGATLNIDTSGGWPFYSISSSQDGVVNNAGTLNMISSGSFEAKFSNLAGGHVNLLGSALLSVQNGGTFAGAIDIAPTAKFWLSEQHGAAPSFSGTSITGGGTLDITGAQPSFDGVSASTIKLKVNNVTAAFTGAGSTFGSVNLSGGTISGSSSITTSGTSTITGGATLSSATWNQAGTLDFNDGNSLTLDSGAVLNNQSGATINFNGTSGTPLGSGSGGGTFNNAGTLNQNASGIQNVNVVFNNSGTVNVNAGTLAANVATQSSVIHTLAGATFKDSSGFTNTGTLSGDGTFDVGTAILVNNGVIAPGANGGGVGTLAILGNLDTSFGTLQIELDNPASYDIVLVSGPVTLGSGTALSTSDRPGASYVANDTFDVLRSSAGTINGPLPTVSGFAVSIDSTLAPASLRLEASTPAPTSTPTPTSTPAPTSPPVNPAPASGSLLERVTELLGGDRGLAEQVLTETDSDPLIVFTQLFLGEMERQQGPGNDDVSDNTCSR